VNNISLIIIGAGMGICFYLAVLYMALGLTVWIERRKKR
jgi:hypothetical protein